MVLRLSDSQFRLRGLISCPGLVSNRRGIKYQAYSNFRVHMVFMCRPNPLPNYLKYSSIWHQTRTIRRKIIFCMWENWSQSKRMFKLYALFILAPKFLDLSFFWKFRTSSPALPYSKPAVNRQPGYRRRGRESGGHKLWCRKPGHLAHHSFAELLLKQFQTRAT